MLEAIPKDQSSKHRLLRVVVSFPLEANFDPDSMDVLSALEADDTALATLSGDALTSAFVTYPNGTLIVSSLEKQLEQVRKDEKNARERKEDSSTDANPRKKIRTK